jgi:hypothetical protein
MADFKQETEECKLYVVLVNEEDAKTMETIERLMTTKEGAIVVRTVMEYLDQCDRDGWSCLGCRREFIVIEDTDMPVACACAVFDKGERYDTPTRGLCAECVGTKEDAYKIVRREMEKTGSMIIGPH